MLQVHRFEVDDIEYQVSNYTAKKGLKLLTRLVKVAGRPIGILAGGASKMEEVGGEGIVADAIEALAQGLDENSTLSLIMDLVEGIIINADGRERLVVFDTDFQGKLGHLFKVLKEIVQFQFSDFLGGLAAMRPAIAAKLPVSTVRAM